MSRFGCLGCFSIIAFLALLALVVLGGVALSGNIFEIPSSPRQDFSQEDGRRFQQKLAEILLRDSNVSSRKEPIIISQRELNAFLVRHLQESERIRFSPLIVQFRREAVEIQGQTELRSLLNGFPFSLARDYFPSSMNHPVWVTVKGQVKIDRRKGTFIVDDFSLGRQALSPWLFTWLIGSAGNRLMEWRVPSAVDRILIEEGRAIIFTHQKTE